MTKIQLNKKLININQILLNYYSFGYSTGLIEDNENDFVKLEINNILQLSKKYNLAGIEFPIDRVFHLSRLDQGIEFIDDIIKSGNKVFIDFEKIDHQYFTKAIPKLRNIGIKKFRIKMNHLGKVFYGGNRFSSNHFNSSLENFRNDLIKLLNILKENDSIALIENHQDLSSIELRNLIENISADYLGINWDIGNSFSVCDTPLSFFNNTKFLIKNVHIKDYKIGKLKDGIALTRCIIGEGAVDFLDIFKRLSEISDQIETLSIELGAQITRNCHIYNEEYWNYYDNSKHNKKEYIENVEHLRENLNLYSDYENGIRGEDLKKIEINDAFKSAANVMSLIKTL